MFSDNENLLQQDKKTCIIDNNSHYQKITYMNFHSYGELASKSVRIITGQSVLIDPSSRPQGTCLEVQSGIARVYCPCEETEGMTLAFLQSGDQLRTDLLCSEGVCVEALTDLSFQSNVSISENSGYDAVNEWTLQLLRIRHLGNAEQRLQALLSILVNRLGRRCGQWCELPFRLTHERIGELIGSTRVTSTRLISKLRTSELLIAPIGTQTVSVAPSFIESSPL